MKKSIVIIGCLLSAVAAATLTVAGLTIHQKIDQQNTNRAILISKNNASQSASVAHDLAKSSTGSSISSSLSSTSSNVTYSYVEVNAMHENAFTLTGSDGSLWVIASAGSPATGTIERDIMQGNFSTSMDMSALIATTPDGSISLMEMSQ